MPDRPASSLRAAAQKLQELVWGEAWLRLLEIATQLGVPDLLAEGPRTLDELAKATDSHRGVLERVARGWKVLGVAQDVEGGRLGIGPLGRLIVRGSTGADRLRQQAQVYRTAFGELETVLRKGGSGFEHARGRSVWKYRESDPALNDSFNRLMADDTERVGKLMLGVYDFSKRSCVVDIGGGSGALLRTILGKHPHLRGILFDLHHVVGDDAGTALAGCERVHGNFLESVPAGGDVYILKRVLHNWDDEHCSTILRRCRAAMKPGTQLLVVELLRSDGPDEDPAVIMSDLMMLVVHGDARERSLEEYRALLAGAGFNLCESIATGSGFQILVADPIEGARGE